jgi:hypothetical protein
MISPSPTNLEHLILPRVGPSPGRAVPEHPSQQFVIVNTTTFTERNAVRAHLHEQGYDWCARCQGYHR